MDLNLIVFKNNYYKENFASYKEGLLELHNLQRLYFENETLINNGENTLETNYYYSNVYYSSEGFMLLKPYDTERDFNLKTVAAL